MYIVYTIYKDNNKKKLKSNNENQKLYYVQYLMMNTVDMIIYNLQIVE